MNLLSLFKDAVKTGRTHSKLKVTCDTNKPPGVTFLESRVRHANVPTHSGALARTIYRHELHHANKDPNTTPMPGVPKYVAEAVDDAILHSVLWDGPKMPAEANRDCLAVGMRDARLVKIKSNSSPRQINASIHCAIRSLAMVRTIGTHDQEARMQAQIAKNVPPLMPHMLNRVVDLCSLNKREEAAQVLSQIMQAVPDTNPAGMQQVIGDLPAPCHGGPEGDELDENMKIIRLQMATPCNTQHRRISRQLGRSGPRLHRPAIARMIASRSPNSAFIRTKHQKSGGACLIDASGSMRFNENTLNAVCSATPMATVAYYYGYGEKREAWGDLCIYAENGMRANSIYPHEGNNAVDLYALQWLLQQPGPRIFVTDMGFCSGPHNQAFLAASLTKHSVESGEITLINCEGVQHDRIIEALRKASGQDG